MLEDSLNKVLKESGYGPEPIIPPASTMEESIDRIISGKYNMYPEVAPEQPGMFGRAVEFGSKALTAPLTAAQNTLGGIMQYVPERLAGIGISAAGSLQGKSPQEIQALIDQMHQQVSEGVEVGRGATQLPNELAGGIEAGIGKAIDLPLEAVRTVGRVESVKEKYPTLGRVYEFGLELATFKAMHSLASRIKKTMSKPVSEMGPEDINTLNESRELINTSRMNETIPREWNNKQIPSDDIIDAEFTVLDRDVRRGIGEGQKALPEPLKRLPETQRRLPEPQRMLPPPEGLESGTLPISKEVMEWQAKVDKSQYLKGKVKVDAIGEPDSTLPPGMLQVTVIDPTSPANGATFSVKGSVRNIRDRIKKEEKVFAKGKEEVPATVTEEPVVSSGKNFTKESLPSNVQEESRSPLQGRKYTVDSAEETLKSFVPYLKEAIEKGDQQALMDIRDRALEVGNQFNPNNQSHSLRVLDPMDKMLLAIEKALKPEVISERAKAVPEPVSEMAEDVAPVPVVKEKAPVGEVKWSKDEGRYVGFVGELPAFSAVKVGSKWQVINLANEEVMGEGFKTLRDAKASIVPKIVEAPVATTQLPVVPKTKSYGWKAAYEKLHPEKFGEVSEAKDYNFDVGEAKKLMDEMSTWEDEGNYVRPKESNKMYQEMAKEQFDELDPDVSMDTYGTWDAVKDAFEFVTQPLKGERGSISGEKLSPEQIAKLDRLRKKSKLFGKKLGDMLKDLGVSKDYAERLDAFAKEWLDPMDGLPQGPDLKKIDWKDWRSNGINLKERKRMYKGEEIRYPEYTMGDLRGWKSSPDIKHGNTVPGKINKKFSPAFREFDQIPFLKEGLWRPGKKAEKLKAVEYTQLINELKRVRGDLGKEGGERIMHYAVSQQEGGMKLLEASGVKAIPKLTPEEMKTYEWMRDKFDQLWDRINDVRTDNGKNPIARVDNYFTFMRSASFFERLGEHFDLGAGEDFLMNEYAKMKGTPFVYGKKRLGGKFKLEENAFKVFDAYIQAALHHIHMTPIVAKARTLLNPVTDPVSKERFNPLLTHPNAYKMVRDWAHAISGYPMESGDITKALAKIGNKINSNIGAATLGGNIRSAVVQGTSLRNTVTELGLKDTIKGISEATKSSQQAMTKSDVLYTRNFDVQLADYKSIMDADFRDFPKLARGMAFKPLQMLDGFVAEATWKGAYSKATTKFKMSESDAIRYADDVVLKTQGSGSKMDVAPIQYTSTGRLATLFQTFVINDWKFLTEDVLQVGKGAKVRDVLPKVLKYTIATALISYLMEDVGGIKSPFPRPIKALYDGIANGQSYMDIAMSVAKELIEPIPIIGNARYGKGPFGPAYELISNMFSGGKYGETPKKEITDMIQKGKVPDSTLQTIGTGLGVPFTAQAGKSFRAYKRGESPWGIAMGTYSEKKGGSSDFYSRPPRPSSGRPQRP